MRDEYRPHTQHTGTIKPFHTSILDSSTSIFLNTFIPLLRMSSSSCSDQHTDTTPVQSHPRRLQVPSRKSDQGLEDYAMGGGYSDPPCCNHPQCTPANWHESTILRGLTGGKKYTEKTLFLTFPRRLVAAMLVHFSFFERLTTAHA